jgi:Holliday junction resolvase-like predicted endonuclease
MDGRKRRGSWAEDLARHWLEARGFRILARNERRGFAELRPRARSPEIDILALRQGELWLLEVKYRTGIGAGETPILGPRQRRRLYGALLSIPWGGARRLGLLWVKPGGRVEFLENP